MHGIQEQLKTWLSCMSLCRTVGLAWHAYSIGSLSNSSGSMTLGVRSPTMLWKARRRIAYVPSAWGNHKPVEGALHMVFGLQNLKHNSKSMTLSRFTQASEGQKNSNSTNTFRVGIDSSMEVLHKYPFMKPLCNISDSELVIFSGK